MSMPERQHAIRLYPWYVHAVLGFLLSPLIPWILVIHALWMSSKRRAAITAAALNILAGSSVFFFCQLCSFEWWIFFLMLSAVNLGWSILAGVYQHVHLGSAAPFMRRACNRHLAGHALFSMLFACCLGFTIMLFSMLFSSTAMKHALGLDRTSILWGAFRGAVYALPFGFLAAVGLAGIGEKLRPAGLVAAVTGFGSSAAGIVLAGMGIGALISGDLSPVRGGLESIIPLGDASPMRWLLDSGTVEMCGAFAALAVLFSTVRTFGGFFLRIGIVLASLLWVLPELPGDCSFAPNYQKRILSDLSNPSVNIRARANRELSHFLSLYPAHVAWPVLALRNADYWYEAGHPDKARRLWNLVVLKGAASARNARPVALARESLARLASGAGGDSSAIRLPLIDYESYLDETWMAFLTVINYWEHASVSDARIKMRLKPFSEKTGSLSLAKMPPAFILDDIARSWGYRVAYAPVSLRVMESFIRSGIPVVYPVFTSPSVCYGFNERSGRLTTYWFSRLSTKTRAKEPSALDILPAKRAGVKPSDRLVRMALECRFDRSLSHLDSLDVIAAEPVLMVIYPDSLHSTVSRCTGIAPATLDSLSDGWRSILMGLHYVDRKNPAGALLRFERARLLGVSPFAALAEHLALYQWEQQRAAAPLGSLPLAANLTPLARYDGAFTSEGGRHRLDSCRLLFENACRSAYLPAAISLRYLDLVPLSSAPERRAGIALAFRELRLHPESGIRWRWLCDAAAWEGNTLLQASACSAYVDLNPSQFRTRLILARLLVEQGRFDVAAGILSAIQADSVLTEPDYFYCLGAQAEHDGRLAEAERCYKTCCSIRRYDAAYFNADARVLVRLRKRSEAAKAQAWAAAIGVSPVSIHDWMHDEHPG